MASRYSQHFSIMLSGIDTNLSLVTEYPELIASNIHIGTVYMERIPRGVLLTFFSIADVNRFISGH